jgi:flagellar basal-body rod protein FlgG
MGVRVSGTQRNFEMGAPQSTQRDLDLMIQGDGFLVIQLPTGEFAYKREGSLHRSATGRIETIEGYPVQPEITLPPATKKVEISHDGNVTAFMSETDRVNLGQLQIATFTNRGGLKAHGKNIFMATEASGPANLGIPGQGSVGPILQGYLESSNVEMVKEMTEMISAQRAYEMNAKVMQAVDQVLQQTSSIR